jgi:ribosomal protein L17
VIGKGLVILSCYFRHIKDLFEEAGLEVTPDNKKDVDRAIHKMVGVAYKDCPAAWRRVKAEFLADEKARKAFVRKLKRLAG